MKLAKIIVTGYVGLSCQFALADMALAESMPASSTTTANEIQAYYKKVQKQRQLTTDESNVVQLVTVANDVFKIQTLIVDRHYGETEKEKSLKLHSVAKSIESTFKQKNTWDVTFSQADRTKIKSVEKLIINSLGVNSYAAAWLAYQDGNKTEAKAILNRGFDKAFDSGMKTEHLGFDDSNPMNEAEDFSIALSRISTESENKPREERLRKMRVRASNLPQIMT